LYEIFWSFSIIAATVSFQSSCDVYLHFFNLPVIIICPLTAKLLVHTSSDSWPQIPWDSCPYFTVWWLWEPSDSQLWHGSPCKTFSLVRETCLAYLIITGLLQTVKSYTYIEHITIKKEINPTPTWTRRMTCLCKLWKLLLIPQQIQEAFSWNFHNLVLKPSRLTWWTLPLFRPHPSSCVFT
jgi:hypothetical protein